MTYSAATPAEVRALIRTGQLTAPTTGYCDGYAQGNLVVLPKALAWDFLLFCQRNPKACPLLEVADAGQRSFSQFAPDSDIARDIPRYRIYRNGELAEETTDVTHYFEEHSLHTGGGVQRQYGGQHAAYSVCPGARSGGHHGGHAPRPRCASSNWYARSHRHHRPGSPGLWRRRHNPPWRDAGVLALRSHAPGSGHALQTGVLHHPRAGTHVYHRCQKYRAEILKGALQCRPLI